MNFRDQRLTCARCGKTFIFTVTEQRRLYTAGQPLTPPTHCSRCRTLASASGRLTGQVKWFSRRKGYGFIVTPDRQEIFFHRSQVVDTPLSALREGTPVTFERVSTAQGDEAHQVRAQPPQGSDPAEARELPRR